MGTRANSAPQSTVGAEFYSLLDAVASESIADDFEIGTYTAKHDFDNHLKTAVFKGINPSDSLAELSEKNCHLRRTDLHGWLDLLSIDERPRLPCGRSSLFRVASFTPAVPPTWCPAQTIRLA